MSRTIDTHVHFYDTSYLDYRWLADRPELFGRFAPQEYAADWSTDREDPAEAAPGLVVVEADCRADQRSAEIGWIEALAADHPEILGVVAAAPVEAPAIEQHLDALAESPLVCGVRRILDGGGELAGSAGMRRGLAEVGRRGLPFDLCFASHQLGDVIELVDAVENVAFVLDHVAKPDIASAEWAGWADQLAELARRDHVVAVKLSGLSSQSRSDIQSQWSRYLEHAIECFGPGRLMFGSDWPVLTEHSSLPRWYGAVRDAAAALEPSSRAQLWSLTASAVYGVSV